MTAQIIPFRARPVPASESPAAHRNRLLRNIAFAWIASRDEDPQPARVAQQPAAWAAGYRLGIHGQPATCPPGVADRLAFASGVVEGKAARSREAPRP
jgi:hypothetical protein